MLELVDDLLAKVLDGGWQQGPKPKFAFEIPDDSWRTKVKGGQDLFLNIYLYEVRENRNFRRASWDTVERADRQFVRSPPPAYLDCHYLISAWSPTNETELTHPTRDEHRTLSEATRVLLRNPEVIPGALGMVDGGDVFRSAHVTFTVASPEPPRVLNDFWSTMRQPWRPATMLVVTAPLDLLQDSLPDPPVLTFVQRLMFRDPDRLIDERIDIGGFVLRAQDKTPVVGATVTRLPENESVSTDARGRYFFARLQRGVHRFRVSANSLRTMQRDIDIPGDPAEQHIFELIE
jgi:hypothetical protein